MYKDMHGIEGTPYWLHMLHPYELLGKTIRFHGSKETYFIHTLCFDVTRKRKTDSSIVDVARFTTEEGGDWHLLPSWIPFFIIDKEGPDRV